MSQWADYQSLISMSIALNAAYFSISSFLTPYASTQRELASLAKQALGDVTNDHDRERFKRELRQVETNIVEREIADRRFTYWFRTIAVVFFIAGLALLMNASIYAGEAAASWIFWVSALLNVPFVVGVLYMTVISSGKFKKIGDAREEIEARMNQAIPARH